MMTEQEQNETRELDLHRDAVRRAVFSGIAHRRVIRHRRQLALVAGAGLLLVAGAAVGAAKLVTVSQADLDHFANCYAAADLTSQPLGLQSVDSEPIDVVEQCQWMWHQGLIGQEVEPEDPNDPDSDFPVPDIAVCVAPDGVTSGFPIWDHSETEAELCGRLFLPVFDESVQTH